MRLLLSCLIVAVTLTSVCPFRWMASKRKEDLYPYDKLSEAYNGIRDQENFSEDRSVRDQDKRRYNDNIRSLILQLFKELAADNGLAKTVPVSILRKRNDGLILLDDVLQDLEADIDP